jgi:hypothetical protein
MVVKWLGIVFKFVPYEITLMGTGRARQMVRF